MDPLDEIAAARGHVSRLWRDLAPDEPFLRAAFRLYVAAMHAPGGLPRRDRELLSFVTSLANRCAYCAGHHRPHLVREGLPKAWIVALEGGGRLPEPRAEGLRELAAALAWGAAAPLAESIAEPLARLEALGLEALEIQQAIQVCAAYGMFNRLALALGTPREAEPGG